MVSRPEQNRGLTDPNFIAPNRFKIEKKPESIQKSNALRALIEKAIPLIFPTDRPSDIDLKESLDILIEYYASEVSMGQEGMTLTGVLEKATLWLEGNLELRVHTDQQIIEKQSNPNGVRVLKINQEALLEKRTRQLAPIVSIFKYFEAHQMIGNDQDKIW